MAFNGTPIDLGEPTDLRVITAHDRLIYRFSVPLRAPLIDPGRVDIRVEDYGYFTAFVLRAESPVEVLSAGPCTASCGRSRSATGAPGAMRCELKRGS